MSTPSSLIASTTHQQVTGCGVHGDRFAMGQACNEFEDVVEVDELTDGVVDVIRRCDLTALMHNLEMKPSVTIQRDKNGLTALMHAVCNSASDSLVVNVCTELLSHGADMDYSDSDGFTATHWAAACGHASVLNMLIHRQPSSAQVPSANGDTPLHRACRLGRIENIATLLAFDETLSRILNDSGETPLHVAGTLNGIKEDAKLRHAVRMEFAKHQSPHHTLILHHPDTLMHSTRTSGSQGTFPWEAPERVTGIVTSISKAFNGDPLIVQSTEFPPATDKDILRCHSREYLGLLKSLEEILMGQDTDSDLHSCIPFTPAVQKRIARLPSAFMKNEALSDTSYSSGTLRAAKRAAGSVIHAIDTLFNPDEKIKNVFCVVRPPGHHVGYAGPVMDKTCTSCGFSILNSVAIGAAYAISERKKRVAIVDIDVHHGNGTEDIVRHLHSPKDLLFVSIHQADQSTPTRFYPGTGLKSDYASNVYNFPIEPIWSGSQSNRQNVLEIVESKIVPLIASFRPDIILMSTGFDGAHGDVGNCLHEPGKASLSGTDLSPQDYAQITRSIMSIANIVCDGRLVSVLEGGYGKMTWTTSTIVTKSFLPDPKRLRMTPSDDSTKGSSDGWSDSNGTSSSSSPTALSKRKRLNREIVHTQVLNRRILSLCAQQHVRGLASL